MRHSGWVHGQRAKKKSVSFHIQQDNNNKFCLHPAAARACSRNPIGTAETVCVVGDLVRGENLQWRKPLACGGLCHVADHGCLCDGGIGVVGSWLAVGRALSAWVRADHG
jgi:hypothetical protein